MEPGSDAREVVISFIKALNDEDFNLARRCVNDKISFVGPMGSRQGAEAYFHDMERLRLKYQVKKVFVDGNDVCLLYDLTISGVTVFSCGWYRVESGKIQSLKVVFDSRPILETRAKLPKSA
jgi:limonene-1,2-epoxide hydrolase